MDVVDYSIHEMHLTREYREATFNCRVAVYKFRKFCDLVIGVYKLYNHPDADQVGLGRTYTQSYHAHSQKNGDAE